MIYLAAPYTHSDIVTVAKRVHQINQATVYLLNQGYFVYSPISSWHRLAMEYDLPKEFDFWETFDKHVISKCDKVMVLMLDGWLESKGVNAEIKYAKILGIEIEYLDWYKLELEINKE